MNHVDPDYVTVTTTTDTTFDGARMSTLIDRGVPADALFDAQLADDVTVWTLCKVGALTAATVLGLGLLWLAVTA